MKRFLSVVWLAMFLVALLPINALAGTPNQIQCAINNSCRYDTNAQCLISGPAGSGPLFGPRFPKVSDTKELATRIEDFIQKTVPGSPFKGLGSQIVELGQKYDVNPAFEVADANAETSLGTTGSGRAPQYDVNGIGVYGGKAGSNYPNVLAGTEGFFKLISSGTYLGPPANLTTIAQIEKIYSQAYERKTLNDLDGMHKILDGITTDSSSPSIAPVSSCADGTTTAGALGWDLGVGPHAMVSYDQGDVRWANHPYGTGKSPLSDSGCGPTAVAMVVATLTGDHSVTPVTIADKYGDKYHVAAGSSHALFPAAGQDYGLKVTSLGTDLGAAANIIRQGGLVIVTVSSGHFTLNGHIMVIRAITPDGTGFYLADPNGDGRNNDSENTAFTSSFLLGQGNLTSLWGFTK
ncbi:MAG TPA: C39 family peptidase [Candidatus Saccharimonadales bacterium]|nr:C39 family peptidase [Candidatus Saccharimonadales bacterium]